MKKVPKIYVEIDSEKYPEIVKRIGVERIKQQIIDYCIKNNLEFTETNIYSFLSNLEQDLSMMFA